jgi:hypothetical protein
MRTFVNIVNAVGGIELSIPDKQTARNTDLTVGNTHSAETQTLKVVRNRSGGGFERADNQNLVMCALRKKLTSPKVVTQIPELIESFEDNIRTDLSPANSSVNLPALAQIAAAEHRLCQLPQELFKQTRVFDPVFEQTHFHHGCRFQHPARIRHAIPGWHMARANWSSTPPPPPKKKVPRSHANEQTRHPTVQCRRRSETSRSARR